MTHQFIALVILALALSGCDNARPSTAQQSPAATTAVADSVDKPPEIALDSPDHAVKSWWRVMDQVAEHQAEMCRQFAKSLKDSPAVLLKKVAYPPAADALSRERATCATEKYDREIGEVKVESETRAIVLAVVRNATPLAAGATPTDRDMKARQQGERFRYTLEKTPEGWKVAQVSEYWGFAKEWHDVYRPGAPPLVPTHVNSSLQ